MRDSVVSNVTTPVPMLFPGPLLWILDDVYDRDECAAWVERIEHAAPASATDNTGFRDQDRVMLDDAPAAEDLYARISGRLPQQLGDLQVLGLNPRLRLYRYRAGQRFSEHTDHWYQPSAMEISLLTVLVYFNDGFTGGHTLIVEPVSEVIECRAGRVAVFQHKLTHEGVAVVSGTKYAMRTDVIYRASSEVELTYLWPQTPR